MKRPHSRPARVNILGVENVAVIQHFVDVGSYGAGEWAPATDSYKMRVATLKKLLQKANLEIRHLSTFNGMVDGMDRVPASQRVVSAEFLLSRLGKSSNPRVRWSPGHQSIDAYTYVDSFVIVDAVEEKRRLSFDDLPQFEGPEPGINFFLRVYQDRAAYLRGLDPMEFDEAHGALLKLRDPVQVIAVVNPAWHAQLVKESESRVFVGERAKITIGGVDVTESFDFFKNRADFSDTMTFSATRQGAPPALATEYSYVNDVDPL